ncbi:hypothetical protein M0804_012615 [Polistes exclamans]|nr:hypothetical protein M0804_012615 [Polistes exclamans]
MGSGEVRVGSIFKGSEQQAGVRLIRSILKLWGNDEDIIEKRFTSLHEENLKQPTILRVFLMMMMKNKKKKQTSKAKQSKAKYSRRFGIIEAVAFRSTFVWDSIRNGSTSGFAFELDSRSPAARDPAAREESHKNKKKNKKKKEKKKEMEKKKRRKAFSLHLTPNASPATAIKFPLPTNTTNTPSQTSRPNRTNTTNTSINVLS